MSFDLLLRRVREFLVPLHPSAYALLAGAGLLTLLLTLLSDTLGLLSLAATLALAFFFRDPERVVPTGSGLIVAPADGTIYAIETLTPPPALGLGSEPMTRVSILQKLTDVHVNRMPVSGTVTSSTRLPGLFADAARAAAAEENERHLVILTADEGQPLALVQMAGTLTRYLVCDATVGSHRKRGERWGVSGSRVDVYLPKHTTVSVCDGQRTIAGETVIAQFVVA